MKKVICILFFLTAVFNLTGQKYDYRWMVGYDSEPGGNPPYWGVSEINFNTEPVEITYIDDTPIYFNWMGGTMSDVNGNLLFYSNGCYVESFNREPMENGGGLNPGNVANQYCASKRGYPIMQGMTILPKPGDGNKYLMLHLAASKVDYPLGIIADKLYYSEIDVSANSGLGKVLEKNQPLLEDTLCYGQLTGVRHANGRDWWIVMPENSSNRYYKFLLTPQGFQGPFEQQIGKVWDFKDWSGQAHFTPDGTKYLRFDTYNNLNIFDFDRCDGTLSNHRYVYINFPEDSVVAGGLAISPSSQYAYVSTNYWLYQFDLLAPDIEESQIKLATFDGFESPPGFPAQFYAGQLAPNGKIYFSCTNSVDYLHVIHNPDQPGLACQFEQHGVKLAGLNAFTMPHYPNYRLYDIPGSICDTLGINGFTDAPIPIVPPALHCTVTPNPSSDFIEFTINEERNQAPYLLTMTDFSGKVIFSSSFDTQRLRVNALDFPPGVYAYKIGNGTSALLSAGKVVVLR